MNRAHRTLIFAILSGYCACKAPSSSIPAKIPAPKTKAPKEKAPNEAQKASMSPEIPIREDGTVFGESELMGTRVSINVYVGQVKSGASAGRAITQAFQEIARIESIASEWIPQSELSRLSQHAGQKWLSVSPELWTLLERSIEVSKATQGRFDITFHAAGRLWDFSPGAQPPSEQELQKTLQLVDYRLIELDEPNKRARLKREGMALGMGAIAKGYGVDRAAKVLGEAGFSNFIVEAGGDTYVSGKKGDKQWRVGIQNPSGPGPIGTLDIENEAVVTSGNYERFFVHDGVYYTHILDPRTGRPILRSKSPRSVTIVADNATDADAYCTAVAVMGRKKGLAFVESRPDLEAIIIDADGSTILSSGLQKRYQALPKSQAPR